MRYDFIDLLFAMACIGIGGAIAMPLASGLPANLRPVAGFVIGICLYLALVYPVYRGLKRFPMILPRCPCCANHQLGFHILAGQFPRITFRCPTCNGEFVVWLNGQPGEAETWEHPVLALKWPYAFGKYHTMQKPVQDVPPNSKAVESLKDRAKRAKPERFEPLLAKTPKSEPEET